MTFQPEILSKKMHVTPLHPAASISLHRFYLVLVFFILSVSSLLADNGRSIFLTSQEVEAIKLKIKTSDWAKKEYDELMADANRLLTTDLKEIPSRGGNWNFYYQSPEQHNLILGEQIGEFQWEHIDKITGKKYTGSQAEVSKDLDGVVVGQVHNLWAKGVVTLGLAYKLTGNKKYARKAIEVLVRYTSLYEKLPIKNRRGETAAISTGYGKLFLQSLEESIWLVNAIAGASLVWELAKEKDQSFIRDSLFYEISKNISKSTREGVSNIDCWQVAALGMTGIFFENKDLIQRGLYDATGGYMAQIEKGINKDGFWYELCPGYHFYALHALMLLNRAANNCGIQLDTIPLKTMLDAPFKIIDHNFQAAGFNDSNTLDIRSMSMYYEWGYTTFKNPEYLYVLNENRGREIDHPGLFTKFALLFGTETIDKTPHARVVSSYNYPASGLAALTTGKGKERLWLNIKYDSGFTNHRHFDVGSFEIKKGSKYISKDLGKGNYASRDHEMWVRTSLSHNTFLVNEQSHPHKMKSECLAFDKDLHFIRLRSEGVFGKSTVTVNRSIVLIDANTIFIADQFTSTGLDSIDFSYHQNGTLINKPEGKALKRLKYAYARLQHPISGTAELEHFSTLLSSGKVAMMSYYHNAPTRWILAEGKTRGKVSPNYLILRRSTDAAPLYWCITLDGSKVTFKEEKKDKAGTHLMLTFSDGRKRLLIIPEQH